MAKETKRKVAEVTRDIIERGTAEVAAAEEVPAQAAGSTANTKKSQKAKAPGESGTAPRGKKRKTNGSSANLDATARVVDVQDDLVTIEALNQDDGTLSRLVKNEVVYVCPTRLNAKGEQERLKAEILRVHGRTADAQVYESTGGVGVGDPVEQSGLMLSVTLGPGLLGQVYDGLQNPLENLAEQFGVYLPRGVELTAVDKSKKWSFTPIVKTGAKVIGPTGRAFTADSIGMALATRNLMEDLRSAGAVTGGPRPFSDRDRSTFLSALHEAIEALKRGR